jgi:DNA-binding XRE family transcriptional regulator
MAKILGVSYVTYHRWEKGLAKPQPGNTEALKKLVLLVEQRRKG